MKEKNTETIFINYESLPEIRYYLEYFGAKRMNNLSYNFDGLNCHIVEYPIGIVLNNHFPIKELFSSYGIENSLDEKTGAIIGLDGLVLLHTVLFGENVEECYEKNLYDAKKSYLQFVLDRNEKIDYEGLFSDFDKTVTPFFSDSFNSDYFVKECVFNISDIYGPSRYKNILDSNKDNRLISFFWRTKDEPDCEYYYGVSGDDDYCTDMIIHRPVGIEQELIHCKDSESETIKYSHGNNYSILIDLKNNTIEENIGDKIDKRVISENDLLRITRIAKSFQDVNKDHMQNELNLQKTKQSILK